MPLQVQNDEDGSDPFAEMVGGLSAEIPPGGRVITRVVLSKMDRRLERGVATSRNNRKRQC